MRDRIFIYGLADPAHPYQIRYVGKANSVEQRFKGHLQSARSGSDLPVHCWIRNLLKAGRAPLVKTLCQVTPHYWEETEVRFIRMYRENGHPLLNVSGGGGASYVAKRAAMAAKLARGKQAFNPKR